MRKIVINGERFFGSRYYGTIRYTYEIIRELDRIAKPGTVTVFAPKCELDQSQFQNIVIKKRGIVLTGNAFIERLTRAVWKYILFPTFCFFTDSLSVNTFPAWGFYGFDIISIYDCTPKMFYAKGSYDEKINTWWQRVARNERKSVRKCKLVLTDSECAKKDIVRAYHVQAQNVRVIPCGWQHMKRAVAQEETLTRFGLKKESFFFSLGSRLPHKNIKWVSCAARLYPDHVFVVTGAHHVVADTGFEGDSAQNMIFTGYLSDEEIKAMMLCCKAFIQPSLYEGFGIPPLEAMSVGADCIVSDIPVFHEVYKNSVWYLDPYNYTDIDLEEIMSRPKEDNNIILNEYSWEKSAQKFWDILKEITNE